MLTKTYVRHFSSNQTKVTTEQFTGKKGKLVSLEDSLDGCERILNDEFADYSERSLYMLGSIDEVSKKNNQYKQESNNNDEPPDDDA